MSDKINWRDIIIEIFEKEPDPDVNWTHTTLGEAIGGSRGTIGRLIKHPGDPQRLDEPKYSQGIALIRIRDGILKKINQPETHDGITSQA